MNKLLAVLMCLVICLLLCACAPDPNIVDELLQGSWFYYAESEGMTAGALYSFNDGVFNRTVVVNDLVIENENGTYTIQGNKINLKYDDPDENEDTSIPFKLDGDKLLFNVHSDGSSEYIHVSD